METATTATAGVAITTPMWLQVTSGLQLVAVVMGIAWLAMQMFYKVRNERRKK